MGAVAGKSVDEVGLVIGGCSAVTDTSAWSQLVRGENADSGALGFAGSFVDIGS